VTKPGSTPQATSVATPAKTGVGTSPSPTTVP
jgi:hypothetical protein